MFRNIILVLSISLIISCNTKEKKVDVIQENEVQTEVVNTPNIFVAKILLESKDGLPISADLYEVNGLKSTILLCHQAGYSRGEYEDTAIKLNHLGYSCVAIDQRSGNEVNGIKNETAQRAKDKGLPTNYIDAKEDIEAAIDYLYEENGGQAIILVGSSYSASLVLLIGKSNPKVKVVAAFSPGEYLKGINVTESISDYKKPVFVTSSESETPAVEALTTNISSEYLSHFKPDFEGIHGSRALWESTEGNDKYWEAFKQFLKITK